MKAVFSLITILLLLLVVSCKEQPKAETATARKNYISRKWEKTKEFFVQSDSARQVEMDTYTLKNISAYPEYKYVYSWFLKKPKERENKDGKLYKMKKGVIEDNGTITHKNLINPSAQNTYKYLFITDDAFYIFDLEVIGEEVNCLNTRRIIKGYGEQPIHDLKYNEKGELSTEIFMGRVEQDLYTKDDGLYFEFKQKGNTEIKNTVFLGAKQNF